MCIISITQLFVPLDQKHKVPSTTNLLGMAMIEVIFFLLDNASCTTLILLLGQGRIVHLPDDLGKKFIHH